MSRLVSTVLVEAEDLLLYGLNWIIEVCFQGF